MADEPRFLEILARDFHIALAAGHAFAALYNFRRNNYRDVAVHLAFVGYDLYSSIKHHRSINENQSV